MYQCAYCCKPLVWVRKDGWVHKDDEGRTGSYWLRCESCGWSGTGAGLVQCPKCGDLLKDDHYTLAVKVD